MSKRPFDVVGWSPVLAGVTVGLAAMLAGCGDAGSDAPIATAQTVTESVAAPIDEDRLAAVIRLLDSLPADRRPAFTPSMEPFDGSALPSESLVAAHRRRYAAAMEPAPHAAVWRDDPAIATALDREHLAADELARTLTRVGCAHQVSHLTDLNELAADTRLNLLRLCEQWDATAGAAEGLAGRNRSLLGEAIGELVALDEYLTLLQAVPESNRRIAHAHWPQLKTFLPPTQLRDQLERIVEVDFVPTVLPVGGP